MNLLERALWTKLISERRCEFAKLVFLVVRSNWPRYFTMWTRSFSFSLQNISKMSASGR